MAGNLLLGSADEIYSLIILLTVLRVAFPAYSVIFIAAFLFLDLKRSAKGVLSIDDMDFLWGWKEMDEFG